MRTIRHIFRKNEKEFVAYVNYYDYSGIWYSDQWEDIITFVKEVHEQCLALEKKIPRRRRRTKQQRTEEREPFYIKWLYNAVDWFDERYPDDTHYMDGL